MPSPSQIIERIRSHGANIMLDGTRLEIVNPSKLPPGASAFIREHGRGIAEFLAKEADFEERAAILEYDGHLNRPVAEYVAKLLLSNPPPGADWSDWSWFVAEGTKIIERGLAA